MNEPREHASDAAVDLGRQRHYQYFYDLPDAPRLDPGRPVLIVHGNCQAEAMRVLFELRYPELTCIRMVPAHELTSGDVAHLTRLARQANYVVTQPIADGYRGLPVGARELVAHATGARHVMVSRLYFAGLHPTLVHVRSYPHEPPVVPYHDLATVAQALGHPRPDVGRTYAQAVREDSIHRLRDKIAVNGCVDITDALIAPGTRSMHVINHPSNSVLQAAVTAAAQALGLPPREEIDPGRVLLRSVIAPVPPAAAELAKISATETYWTVGGERVQAETIIDAHLRFYREHPQALQEAQRLYGPRIEALLNDSVLGQAQSQGENAPRQPSHRIHQGMGQKSTPNSVRYVVLGPEEHGVTRHAEALAKAVAGQIVRLPGENPVAELTGLFETPTSGSSSNNVSDSAGVHLHVTDHLLGRDAETIEKSIAALRAAKAPIHLTLHDIPQPGEGAERCARRSRIYADLVALAETVQVCSEHEKALLRNAIGADAERAHVVRLPVDVAGEGEGDGAVGDSIDAPASPDSDTAQHRNNRPTVAALGFIHPGKHPEQLIDLAAGIGGAARFIGGPSEGHETAVDDVVAYGAQRGVDVSITGYLSDEEMDREIAHADIPVAAYRHISASGSIGRWVAAGRRPIVLNEPWAREFAGHAPWALTVVDSNELADAVARAAADPSSTWTSGAREGLLSTEQAARAQEAVIVGRASADPAQPQAVR